MVKSGYRNVDSYYKGIRNANAASFPSSEKPCLSWWAQQDQAQRLARAKPFLLLSIPQGRTLLYIVLKL